MSGPIVVQAGDVSPGDIQFYDAIQPPLPAGDYVLHAKQEVLNLKEETVPQYDLVQPMRVDGPRFSIDPSAIHMVYPPANQAGTYHDVLPNIVFGSFALPWMRDINPSGVQTPGSPPWMGLLTVYEEELGTLAGAPVTMTAGQVTHPDDPAILPPDLPGVLASDEQAAAAMDVDLPFFLAIAPQLAELQMLAHARAVNTDHKAMLGLDEDGCFSLLMSNRIVGDGTLNSVYLVSFEGHQDHLPGGPQIPPQYNSIRLVVLGSWSFRATPSPGGFLKLMAELCNKGNGGIDLLMIPPSETTAAQPLAKEALDIGYVPLENRMRVGERSTSWYRGPLVPAPTARDFAYGPYHTSDHAMHYDPDYGVFNHAYAAAWQIGRLLALSDANFARSLFEWRRGYLRNLKKELTRNSVEMRVSTAMGTSTAIPAGSNLQVHMRQFFASLVFPVSGAFPTIVPRDARRPGGDLFTSQEIDEIRASGEDPAIALRNKVMERKTP